MTTSSNTDRRHPEDGDMPTSGRIRRRAPEVRDLWRSLAVACLAASSVLAVGLAGISPWVGSAVVAAPCFVVLVGLPGAGLGEAAHTAAETTGARLMVGQVVPVWRRQLEMARSATETGFESMLETFARLSQGLSDVADRAEKLSPAQHAGATD